jgi:diaminopimelate decarboxylase
MLSLDECLLLAAEKFGTPLYAYDLQTIEEMFFRLRRAIPSSADLLYSIKANPNSEIVKNFVRLGAGLEVCSQGELSIALKSGVGPAQILVVGPGKSTQLLSLAVSSRVGFVVVESLREFAELTECAVQQKQQVSVGLRVNPGLPSGGQLSMSGATQFGMDVNTAKTILRRGCSGGLVNVTALHGYLGTGILDEQAIVRNTAAVLGLCAHLQSECNWKCDAVDLGGGFGIPYFEGDRQLDDEKLADGLNVTLEDYCRQFSNQRILFESGRFLVGSAGVFLSTVVDIKSVGEQAYVILDGGTNCIELGAQYFGMRPLPMRVLGKKGGALKEVSLFGPLCTPTDRLAAHVLLPEIEEGDVIAFYQAGAYGFTAAPVMFLSHPSALELLVADGQSHVIRQRVNQW